MSAPRTTTSAAMTCAGIATAIATSWATVMAVTLAFRVLQ